VTNIPMCKGHVFKASTETKECALSGCTFNQCCLSRQLDAEGEEEMEFVNATREEEMEFVNATREEEMEFVNATQDEEMEFANAAREEEMEFVNATRRRLAVPLSGRSSILNLDPLHGLTTDYNASVTRSRRAFSIFHFDKRCDPDPELERFLFFMGFH